MHIQKYFLVWLGRQDNLILEVVKQLDMTVTNVYVIELLITSLWYRFMTKNWDVQGQVDWELSVIGCLLYYCKSVNYIRALNNTATT